MPRLCEWLAISFSATVVVSLLLPLLFIALSPLLYGEPRSLMARSECGECVHAVAVFFYVWYERGKERGHWAHRTVVDEPAIGYYSSMDIDAIEWQLKMIRDAGIDVLFISWWGPGSYEDRAAKIVFSLLRRYGLKAAILVEPFRGSDLWSALVSYGPEFWHMVLPYIEREFIDRYPDAYFRLCGKPLILMFAPVGLFYTPRDDRYVFRVVAVYNDILEAIGLRANWDLWPWYLAPWTRPEGSVALIERSGGYVAIAPRYDDTISCELGERTWCNQRLLDPTYSLGIYAREWHWILKHAKELCLVAIYSWNEYHERSEIEPHIDATAHGCSPYNVTREYARRLRAVWIGG